MINKKTKYALMVVSLLILTAATAWILIDNKTAPYNKMEGKIFGTFYHITYQSTQNLDEEILQQLAMVDNSLSAFNQNSTVSLINQNKSTQTDKMFNSVFNLATEISDKTDGAFDVTVAPLVNLWGFGFKNSDQVTQSRIDSILTFVGYKNVSLKKSHFTKSNPQTMIDFSAIAKGYGCDVVAEFLSNRGVNNYMIEIGGEIRANGVNSSNLAWTVGIVEPTEDSIQQNQTLRATIQKSTLAMATSGNYRNFYYKDGQKFAHTIDPHTGRPVQHSLLSATVIAPTCAMADAYATAFMVMGFDKAKALLSSNPKLQAYLIYADDKGNNQTWCSPSIQKYIDANN